MRSFVIHPDKPLRIVLGEAPDRVEQTAARELAGYLQKITGREIPIGPGIAGNSIVLGTPASSELIRGQAGAHRLGALKPGGFMIAPAGGQRLFIMAGASNGVLYGVYAFLESLGVGFAPAGLDMVKERIPRPQTVTFDKTLREEPAFAVRALSLCGWVKEVLAEKKAFYDTDVRKFLPIYTRALDWMARYRLNSTVLWLWWFGSGAEYRWYWSRENEKCDDVISGLILYRDYPKLRWAEKYGDQIRRNQEMLRDIIGYAADRGIRVTIAPTGEPGYPGGLCAAYPQFGKDGTQYIEHEDVWLKFQESRFRELFDTFPGLGGYMYVLSPDCGNVPADIRGRGRAQDGPDTVDGGGDVVTNENLKRLARMNEAMLRGRNAAKSQADIIFWEWAASGVYPGDTGLMGKMKSRVAVARLNALLPEDICIHMRVSPGEPTETYDFNPFLGQWRCHRRSAALHQYAEHHGLNLFPPVFWESSWRERVRYVQRCGMEGLLLEAGYCPGEKDGTGLNLCDIDIHGFARLAWDTAVDRDAVWREWAGIYFPEAPVEVVNILRPFYQVIIAMCGVDDVDGAVPGRLNFKGIPVDKLIQYNVPVSREHALLMIARRGVAVQLLDVALAQLDAIGGQLGAAKYGFWKKNMQTQRALAELLQAFVAATAWGSLIQQELADTNDIQELEKALKRIEHLVEDYEHPLPPLMHRLAGWGWMSGDEWRRVFGDLVKEFRRRFSCLKSN